MIHVMTTLLTCALPLVLVHLFQYLKGDLTAVLRLPAPVRGLAYTAMFLAFVWYGVTDARPFIYFQF